MDIVLSRLTHAVLQRDIKFPVMQMPSEAQHDMTGLRSLNAIVTSKSIIIHPMWNDME